MAEPYVQRMIPFIRNMNKNQRGVAPRVKEINENGKYRTLDISCIKVDVEGGAGEELTPEAQEEIIYETEF